MSAVLDGLPEEERRLIRRARVPDKAGAMKATLTDERFSDPDWIFERKLDGIRCIAIRDGKAGEPAVAQRPVAERALPGAGRGARGREPASAS